MIDPNKFKIGDRVIYSIHGWNGSPTFDCVVKGIYPNSHRNEVWVEQIDDRSKKRLPGFHLFSECVDADRLTFDLMNQRDYKLSLLLDDI